MDASSSTAEAAVASASPMKLGESVEEAPMTFDALHLSEGFCEIAHISTDGRSMLSAGWDGKLASMNTAVQPPSRTWMVSIAGRGGMLTAAAVSADANWLALAQECANGFGVWVCPLDGRQGPNKDKLKLVSRFTLPVRHLSWHPSKPLLGVATEDGKLLTWDRETGKRRDFKTGGAGGSVRCLAFDPQGELLAAALASGALVVFGLEKGEEKYRGSAWPKNVVASERLLMAWRPDGSSLALPGSLDGVVRLVARGNYGVAETHLEGGHRYATSLAAWSPDGARLATASLEAIALWRAPVCIKVGKVELSKASLLLKVCRVTVAPYSLIWAGANSLTVGTVAGSWARLTAPTADDEPSIPTPTKAAQVEQDAESKTPEVELSKSQDSASVAATPLHQASFQAGATNGPDPRRRYLAFNEHGALKLFLGDTKEQSGQKSARVQAAGRVEVEYSRLRFRAGMREIKAPDGLVMGALGPGTCALATAPIPAANQPAKVIVHLAMAKMGEKKVFEQVLPSGEEVAALVVGKLFVATLTSNSNLRVQTVAGMPIDVQVLSGSPVCLVAGEDMLLCITKKDPSELGSSQTLESSPPEAAGSQAELFLEYVLYGITAKERLASGRLPLSAGASLRWCGFSSEALPLALDSAGQLRCLTRSGEAAYGEWVSAAELEGSGERLWPVHAEKSSLFCAELSKAFAEPRVGVVQKLHPVQFLHKKEQVAQPAKPSASAEPVAPDIFAEATAIDPELAQILADEPMVDAAEEEPVTDEPMEVAADEPLAEPEPDACSLALKDFEVAARAEDEHEAMDVILNYFDAHTMQRARLLEEAHALAVDLAQESLAERLSMVMKAACGSAPRKAEKTESSSLPAAAEPSAPAAAVADVAQRIAENRAKALERKAAAEATKAAVPAATGGLDPEVARRIAENRAKALERKAAASVANVGEKRLRSPSEEAQGQKRQALAEVGGC